MPSFEVCKLNSFDCVCMYAHTHIHFTLLSGILSISCIANRSPDLDRLNKYLCSFCNCMCSHEYTIYISMWVSVCKSRCALMKSQLSIWIFPLVSDDCMVWLLLVKFVCWEIKARRAGKLIHRILLVLE